MVQRAALLRSGTDKPRGEWICEMQGERERVAVAVVLALTRRCVNEHCALSTFVMRV